MVDAGSPPGRGMDGTAHAGTLSFEMSAAHERLVVNCGTYPGAPREWRHFMRYTAAHSTAVVDDTNSTEITTMARSSIAPATCWSIAPRTRARSGST